MMSFKGFLRSEGFVLLKVWDGGDTPGFRGVSCDSTSMTHED